MLAPKVVPRGSRGVKEAPRKALWEALGLPCLLGTHLGSFSDRFDVILGSFGDLFGIFWRSSGSHFFDYSEFGSRAQTPIRQTHHGVETCGEVAFSNHGS